MNGSLHLVAHVGRCGLLFDAQRVDSVVEVGRVVPVPGAGAAVIGLAAMRSRVATVLDVRPLFGLPARTRQAAGGRAVATIVDGHLYAVSVDSLEDVASFVVTPPPPGLGGGADWSFVRGVAEGDGETLLCVDVDQLVRRADMFGCFDAVNAKNTDVRANIAPMSITGAVQ